MMKFLQAHYPFKYPIVREIENGNHEAHYKIIDTSRKERAVVFADTIDTQEEAENRLDYDGGHFRIQPMTLPPTTTRQF